ncbi:MAG TPA: glycosyltransferase family 2 protein [Acidobacteriaceae bacterium]
MDIAVILPTYNERQNIPVVISRLGEVLQGYRWEAIFVDDDSPDGTAEVIAEYARGNPNIRLLHRIGRRGLSSACIEGMLSTQATFIAVMDADLQHDEAILPQLLETIRSESLDLVVATRNSAGGSMGDFSRRRVLLSRLGRKVSEAVCRCELTDPMSGYFILRRSFLGEVVRDLQCSGFKILVDLLASSRRPVRVAEVGYTFRARQFGESKLDVLIGVEHLALIVNKLTGNILPGAMPLYLFVGGLGLITHFVTLFLLTRFGHFHFVAAQSAAALAAMTENFFLNDRITFAHQRLRGARLLSGLARFTVACSFGAWANVVFAYALWQSGMDWYLAGFAGIVLGSVWNLSISSQVTWRSHRRAAIRGKELAHERMGAAIDN